MKNLFLFVLVLAISVSGAVKRVPVDYQTIQSAINASVNGDTVLVSPGTYYENIFFRGKKIVVGSLFLTSNDNSYIKSTIINGSTPLHADTASCVLFINNEDPSSELVGFTLTGGKGTRWTDEHGGQDYFEGGGILTALSSPTIRNNIIINNEAIRKSASSSAGGGGIRSGDGAPRIINNVIIGNKGMYGGGIVLNYCAGAIIKNNVITKNVVYQAVGSTPTYGGGGIWINNQLPMNSTVNVIENNNIISNSSSGTTPSGWAGYGGGVFVTDSKVSFNNNIIWGNTQAKGKQFNLASGLATVTYNNIQDGYTGTGNVSTDPMFADTSYYLQNNSAMIDAGNPDSNYNDPADPNNTGNALFPSKGTVRSDMGVYGGKGRKDLPYVIVTGVKDKETGNLNYRLEQNYPNPFNPTTVIKYSVAKAAELKIRIFNLTGEEVAVLINKFHNPGVYEVIWNSKNGSGQLMPSGIYFYRIESGSFTEVKKMMLVR